MRVEINSEQFARAHRKFKQHMLEESDGVPFTDFHHPFLFRDEIRYKYRVLDQAAEVLTVEAWPTWRETQGRILDAVRLACVQSVSANLVEHRWPDQAPYNSLERVQSDDVPMLETVLFNFFEPKSFQRSSFGSDFDKLAETLRALRVGCQWSFVAYLAFLAQPHMCFPIRPTYFDRLLQFYGNDTRIAGRVTWDRYERLLDLAELLREKLAIYGRANAIEIQSYMFVVSYLIKESLDDQDVDETIDLHTELERRRRAAEERERIGLKGEIYVFEAEKKHLQELGCDELCRQVELVSVGNHNAGYDILSFESDGSEKHIEVKTTQRSKSIDQGFWISENERQQALSDPCWTLCRVWEVDGPTNHEVLGNIIRDGSQEWQVNPSTWWVERAASCDHAADALQNVPG